MTSENNSAELAWRLQLEEVAQEDRILRDQAAAHNDGDAAQQLQQAFHAVAAANTPAHNVLHVPDTANDEATARALVATDEANHRRRTARMRHIEADLYRAADDVRWFAGCDLLLCVLMVFPLTPAALIGLVSPPLGVAAARWPLRQECGTGSVDPELELQHRWVVARKLIWIHGAVCFTTAVIRIVVPLFTTTNFVYQVLSIVFGVASIHQLVLARRLYDSWGRLCSRLSRSPRGQRHQQRHRPRRGEIELGRRTNTRQRPPVSVSSSRADEPIPIAGIVVPESSVSV